MSLTLSEILFEINRATLGDQQRFNNLVFTPKRHCYHEKRIEKKPLKNQLHVSFTKLVLFAGFIYAFQGRNGSLKKVARLYRLCFEGKPQQKHLALFDTCSNKYFSSLFFKTITGLLASF